MKIDDLEIYLHRSDVPLGTKINTLIGAGLTASFFIPLAEDLVERASAEEAYEYREQIMRLAKIVGARRQQKV